MGPRILVLGAGAVGGYFGGRLAEGGADVTFLVRPARRAQLAERGIAVRSDFFDDFAVSVETVTGDAPGGPYDLIVIACKAYDLGAAMDAVALAMGPGTAILPLLNGMRQIDLLQARFGDAAVLGGTCYIGAGRDAATGDIVHFGDFHRIACGELAGGRSARVEAFAALNDSVKFDIEPSEEIEQVMWDKFAMLSAMASVTTLARGAVGEILDTPSGQAFLTAALAECRDAAAALGHRVSDATLALYERMFATRGSRFASSMLRDVQAGLRTEGEHVIGDMVDRAAAIGHETPILLAARAGLAVHENGLAGAGAAPAAPGAAA